MRTVSAMQLRQRIGELLDAASAGERIVIERDRRPLAMLVSYEAGMRLEESEEEKRVRFFAALGRLDEIREREAQRRRRSPGDPDAVALIREDRSRDDTSFDPTSILPGGDEDAEEDADRRDG